MNRSELVLAVTSSTAVVGVALTHGLDVLAESHVITDRRHAEELTPMIERVLTEAGRPLGDIDRFAVDVGPGRFTGLRVGLATIRTLALATGAPVVGVTSLEILAADVSGPVCAVIDARRHEVFQQRFVDGAAISSAAVGLAADLAALVEPADTVVGDGADRYAAEYSVGSHLAGRGPSAVTLARLAADREAVLGSTVEPVYLRDADVQINIKTRHNT